MFKRFNYKLREYGLMMKIPFKAEGVNIKAACVSSENISFPDLPAPGKYLSYVEIKTIASCRGLSGSAGARGFIHGK